MKVGSVPSTDPDGPLRERNNCLKIDGHSTQFGRSLLSKDTFQKYDSERSWTVTVHSNPYGPGPLDHLLLPTTVSFELDPCHLVDDPN